MLAVISQPLEEDLDFAGGQLWSFQAIAIGHIETINTTAQATHVLIQICRSAISPRYGTAADVEVVMD